MSSGAQRVRKLQWRCRRGMKELDVLLERFLAAERDRLAHGEWPAFEAFLDEEDDRLWDWLQGRISPDPPAYQALVDRIRD